MSNYLTQQDLQNLGPEMIDLAQRANVDRSHYQAPV